MDREGTFARATVEDVAVLLVEDNKADARLVAEVFRESGIPNTLYVVGDGVEAIDFLRRRPPFAGQRLPGIILLDLNLPRMDGREVLQEIKSDPVLCRIPVVVMTTSDAQDDISSSYSAGASCFITKPDNVDEFISVVKLVRELWLVTARLPLGLPG